MAPALPWSLSPHICLISSPDLNELLAASSLPPLPNILQSFSPLPQVTTRTTSLTSVPHSSFSLRFSDLIEIEKACKEDEEQRAVRTIDWIGSRISHRCAQWVEDVEKLDGKQTGGVPWWDELRRCIEGDHVPSRTETWNHPAAVILAVSTNTTNPLQVITNLHSRSNEFPSWVDPMHLRYTLIVHPKNSMLSDEEAGALYNAVKKQFGLHSYLLPLDMPNPPPPPVPVPTIKPRLPAPFPESPEIKPQVPEQLSAVSPTTGMNTLRMNEKDIQHTARFTREFLVMSLIPWMEKCVVDWNENFSSTRRLPSRLFSSTRRLFGSPSPSPAPTHQHNSSSVSIPARSSIYNGLPSPSVGGPTPPPQQRRLAEFATILGDFKLAVSVWEALRKEGKGGADILPLLLSPTPTISLHVSSALSSMLSITEPPAYVQLQALSYAIRWEVGIGHSDFIGDMLEGERWLVWAAGKAEEPPFALLLAHAALLSAKKYARRRAALWYLSAANRLEKSGIKPLTMYFLRRAHGLYRDKPAKELSPSFWESEGTNSEAFNMVMPCIEHPLGRLLYTTGHVKDAVRIFLNLLKGSALPYSTSFYASAKVNSDEGASAGEIDRVYLEDFRTAFEHLRSDSSNAGNFNDFQLPFSFCLSRRTSTRFPRDSIADNDSEWDRRKDVWVKFCKERGMTAHFEKDCKAFINEMFWVDLVLQNPLNVEVNLGNLTVTVREVNGGEPSSSKSFVEVEVIGNIVLGPKETRTIPISIKSARSASLVITHATYDFLSILPVTESLSSRGRRLHNTPAQRHTPTYAPDVLLRVDVAETGHRLVANFVNAQRLILRQGEDVPLTLWLSNIGIQPIGEMWIVPGPEDDIRIGEREQTGFSEELPSFETWRSHNSLKPQEPFRVSLSSTGVLNPDEDLELPLAFHAQNPGQKVLSLLLLYRENDEDPYQQVKVTQVTEIRPILKVIANVRPSSDVEGMFMLDLELLNLTSAAELRMTQVSVISPSWRCHSVAEDLSALLPAQSLRLAFAVNPWQNHSDSRATLEFVLQKLGEVAHGKTMQPSDPPPMNICLSHVVKTSRSRSLDTPFMHRYIQSGRRYTVMESITASYPHIPSRTYPHIFPLYNPDALDVLVFWEIPSQARTGSILVSGLNLGAGHAALRDTLEDAESGKPTRSMYAETRRERAEVIQAIRDSEWNTEMNPLLVTLSAVDSLSHDFSKGPCRAPVIITVRNYSNQLKSRFVLRLRDQAQNTLHPDCLPATYCSRLTHRGVLEPVQQTSFSVTIWISRPGTYVLGGWHLETQVLEPSSTPDKPDRIRHRYTQEPSLDATPSLVVCSI